MIYQKTRCPYCGHTTDSWKQTGLNDLETDIGRRIGKCISCGRTYKTGKKPWQEMKGYERLLVYLRVVIGAVFVGMFVGVFLLFVFFGLNEKFQWIYSNENFLKAFLICWIIGVVFSSWSHIRHLNRLKRNE